MLPVLYYRTTKFFHLILYLWGCSLNYLCVLNEVPRRGALYSYFNYLSKNGRLGVQIGAKQA